MDETTSDFGFFIRGGSLLGRGSTIFLRRNDGSFTFAGELEVVKLTWEFSFDKFNCFDLTITVDYLPL